MKNNKINQTNLSIKNWSDDDKPREKLIAKGRQVLSDAELFAILIGSGNREESAIDLCKRILNKSENNLNNLAKFSVQDLMKFKGIGEAKAITIIAALEIGRRRKASEILEKPSISSSKDLYEYIRPVLEDLPHEEFWVIFLNRKNKIIGKQLIGRGGLSQTTADIKLIFKASIDKLASSIILSHNHPSGNINPSKQDIKLTEQVKKAAEIFTINLFDHLIIGDSSYYSFADNSLVL